LELPNAKYINTIYNNIGSDFKMKLKKIQFTAKVKKFGGSGHIITPKQTVGRKAKVEIE